MKPFICSHTIMVHYPPDTYKPSFTQLGTHRIVSCPDYPQDRVPRLSHQSIRGKTVPLKYILTKYHKGFSVAMVNSSSPSSSNTIFIIDVGSSNGS